MEDLKENESISENDPGETPEPTEPDPGTEEPVTPDPVQPDPGTDEPVTPDPGEETGEPEEPSTEDTMQDILDDLRETLGQKDTDIDSLTESVRSLVNAMSIEAYSVEREIPFSGWESWIYPIRMEFQVYPYGAGHWMPGGNERFGEPAAFASRYRQLVSLCGDGGSLKDFYITYIYEDAGSDERLVYDYEALTEEEPAVDIPFEGYENWNYPVGMQYEVYPYGAGYWMKATDVFSTPQEFVQRYVQNVSLCGDGGTLKDFIVEYIWEDYGGSDQNLVYDYQANQPDPEPDPGDEETKETVELLLSHLEGINTTLEEMLEADLEYYQAQNDYQTEMLKLQAADTGSTIILCIAVFAVFAEMLMKHLLEGIK